ncbi:VPLPA-CTERM sorting domain-containing protein [Jannaschia sp. W003]|uniref:VPLPA-CTERM sorting domain-containing protein n=1 Tax=Jannaschia sp. W003 TaxID=2867012 RepID=UPI0021A27D09|nr:VPLPA-CTERM sorting domain-containing protein [Jannaschia sp. W003]UWQ22385.1 VPLPA-CTERM sorting domain-containing protein [Jannaschia sp. W003]
MFNRSLSAFLLTVAFAGPASAATVLEGGVTYRGSFDLSMAEPDPATNFPILSTGARQFQQFNFFFGDLGPIQNGDTLEYSTFDADGAVIDDMITFTPTNGASFGLGTTASTVLSVGTIEFSVSGEGAVLDRLEAFGSIDAVVDVPNFGPLQTTVPIFVDVANIKAIGGEPEVPSLSPVPLPAGMPLLIGAFASMIFVRRRKRAIER